jgi:hypothetical protein
MDIKYSRPGVMEVILDGTDLANLDANGYTMNRRGLYGHDSKTHVEQNESVGEPTASLDGDADVLITLPRGRPTIPIFIGREAITALGDDVEGRLDWFFGKLGGVRVVVGP